MVTYELLEKTNNKILYIYHPEDDRDSDPGIIAVYTDQQKIMVEKAAGRDSVHVATVEGMNDLREAINASRKEEGLPELTEDELPRPTHDEEYFYYASHAMSNIREKLNSGQIPENGMSAWY